MLINLIYTSSPPMHHGTTKSCSVCLVSRCLSFLLLRHCLLMKVSIFLHSFLLLLIFLFPIQRGAPQTLWSASQSFNFLPWWKALKLIAPSVYYMPPLLPSLLPGPLSSSPSVYVCSQQPLYPSDSPCYFALYCVSSTNAVPGCFFPPNTLWMQTLKICYYCDF